MIFSYLQITEPLRPKNILLKCIRNLMINQKINSSFAGYEMKKNFWLKQQFDYKMISKVGGSNLPRQKRESIFRQDCGVDLASRKKILMSKKKLYFNPVKIVPYSGYEGLLDIHTKDDIILAKYLKKLI